MNAPNSLRLRYYAYRATTSLGFYVPINVVYLLDQGFGVAFVALTQAVFSATLLAAEVPSGYLGDRLPRRTTLAVGSLLRASALVGYVVADAAPGYLILKVLMGMGWAFRSGTKDAWLYDLLSARGDADRFARVEGRGSTAVLATSAAGAVVGGVLYGLDPAFPFLVNAVLAALALPVLASIPPVGRGSDRPGPAAADGDDSPPDGDTFTVRAALDVLALQVRRSSVRWVVAYTVLIFLVFDLSRTFEQPALDAVGVPVVGMGLLYAALKLVSAGAAATAGWFQERFGTRATLALAAPVVAVTYGAVAAVPFAVVPALFVYRSARVVLRPVRNQYLNDRLDGVGRATVLSGVSMVLSLAGVVARVAGGAIAEVTGPVAFLGGAGVALAVAAVALWIAVSPVRPAGSESADAPAVAD
ncbi:MAG: MFS transporter [Halobacteriales archaeon]